MRKSEASRASRGASRLLEDKLASAAAATALVDFDADEPCLLTEPVDATHAGLPATAHARTTTLIRLSDLVLRAASVPKRCPLLWCHGRHERGMHSIKHVEVRDGTRLRWTHGESRTGRSCRRGSRYDDGPWELRRTEDETGARRHGRLRGGLGKGMRRNGRVGCTIEDCPCGRSEGYVVRERRVVKTRVREQRVHMQHRRSRPRVGAGVRLC